MCRVAHSRKAEAFDIAIALAIAALGFLALLAPDTVLHVMPDCLISKVLPGWCLGCGMTHAAVALLRGNFVLAWQSNKLSLLVMPLLIYLYVQYLRMIWQSRSVM